MRGPVGALSVPRLPIPSSSSTAKTRGYTSNGFYGCFSMLSFSEDIFGGRSWIFTLVYHINDCGPGWKVIKNQRNWTALLFSRHQFWDVWVLRILTPPVSGAFEATIKICFIIWVGISSRWLHNLSLSWMGSTFTMKQTPTVFSHSNMESTFSMKQTGSISWIWFANQLTKKTRPAA